MSYQVKYTTKNNGLEFSFEAADHMGVIDELSGLQEIFEEPSCGCCGKTNLRFLHRTAGEGKKTYDFYEMKCQDCNARLSFGQLADGSKHLFPKRKDDQGNWDKQHRGWKKFVPQNKD